MTAHLVVQMVNGILYNDVYAILCYMITTLPFPFPETQITYLLGYWVFNLNPASCSAKNIGPLLSNSSSGFSSVA